MINGNAGEYSQTTLSKGGAPMATDVYVILSQNWHAYGPVSLLAYTFHHGELG